MNRLLWQIGCALRRRHSKHLFDIICRGPDGRVLWTERAVPNRLFNEGELLYLKAIYRGESVFGAAFYARLYNTTPVDTDTLPLLAAFEMVGNGYAPVPWDRNTTDWSDPTTLPTGEGETLGVIKGWTASGGNIGPFTHVVLATTPDNTGKALAYASLGGARTILNGSTWEIRPHARSRGVSA